MKMAAKDPAELTAAAIQRAVGGSLSTAEDLSPCYRICEGSEHNVWCVGRDLILRGLLATGRSDGKSEASLKRDRAVSQLLRRYISNPGLVPEVYTIISVDGWICNLETRVHGKSLEVADPTARTEEKLAVFLKVLASVPVEDARQAVDYEEWRPNMRKRVSKTLRAWDDLIQSGYMSDCNGEMHSLLKQKLALLNTLNNSKDQQVLLHAYISGEHIIVGDEDGEVKGIID